MVSIRSSACVSGGPLPPVLSPITAMFWVSSMLQEFLFHSAEIYVMMVDMTMAIVNFSLAVKANPDDHQSYIRRAEVYEKVRKNHSSSVSVLLCPTPVLALTSCFSLCEFCRQAKRCWPWKITRRQQSWILPTLKLCSNMECITSIKSKLTRGNFFSQTWDIFSTHQCNFPAEKMPRMFILTGIGIQPFKISQNCWIRIRTIQRRELTGAGGSPSYASGTPLCRISPWRFIWTRRIVLPSTTEAAYSES